MAQNSGVYKSPSPKSYGEVVLENVLKLFSKVSAKVDIQIGDVLFSSDGGKTFSSAKYDEFSTSKNYNTNDKVVYSGKIYSAKSSVSAGAFNTSDWNDEAEYIINGIYANESIKVSSGTVTKNANIVVAGAFNKDGINDFNESIRVAMFKNSLVIRG